MLFNPSRPNPRLKKKTKIFIFTFRWCRRATRGGSRGGLPCPKLEFQNLCPNFRTASVKGGSFLCPKCVNRVLTIFFEYCCR